LYSSVAYNLGQSKRIETLHSAHCTVVGARWIQKSESNKSLRRDRECRTELFERAFFEPCPIQQIQSKKQSRL